MKTLSLTRIIVALLVTAAVFVLARCGSDAKKAEVAVTSAEGNKMMSETKSSVSEVERGHYIVTTALCNDCHSPKIMTREGPVADSSRLLSGHPADSKIPAMKNIGPQGWISCSPDLTAWLGPWGLSFTANLTPDSTTGLGAWNTEMFMKAMRTGKHMGVETGRTIVPPMPWNYIGQMTDEDLRAVFVYLLSLKPIVNKVPANLSPPEMAKM